MEARMETYFIYLGVYVRETIVSRYTILATLPTNIYGKKIYTNNVNEKNTILSGLSGIELIKVMHCN